MNQNHIPEEPRKKSHTEKFIVGYVYLGLMLIVAGALWMLYNFNMLSSRFVDVFISMPMLMIVGGGFLLCIRKYVPGSIVGGIGLALLALKISEMPLVYIVKYGIKVGLPLAVIVGGIILIVTKLSKR